MKILVVALLTSVAVSAQSTRMFVGTISDDMCAKADHSGMRMGSTDAECTTACVSAHDAAYVLWDGRTTYKLAGHSKLEAFAGRRVNVTGVLEPRTRTIRVDSITAVR